MLLFGFMFVLFEFGAFLIDCSLVFWFGCYDGFGCGYSAAAGVGASASDVGCGLCLRLWVGGWLWVYYFGIAGGGYVLLGLAVLGVCLLCLVGLVSVWV